METVIECIEIAEDGLQTSASAKGLSDLLPKAEIDAQMNRSNRLGMITNKIYTQCMG